MKNSWQISFLTFVFIVIFGAIFARLFFIQIIKYDFYKALAEDQHQIYQKLIPKRGEIYLQDTSPGAKQFLYPIVANRDWPMVYAVPAEIPKDNRNEIIENLSSILGLDKGIIAARLSKEGDPYEPLKYKLTNEEVEKIKEFNYPGIKFSSSELRFYPSGSLASHVLGFLGFKGDERAGQYGVEETYDEILRGKEGILAAERGIGGYLILTNQYKMMPAENGVNLVLTLDYNIQFIAEQKLKEAIDKWQAEKGTIIVMDPRSGAIRALANYPSFDLNDYSKIEDINVFLNFAVQGTYEPGSVIKPITMAAALDSGVVTPQTTYTDEGSVRVGGYTISNADGKKYGLQTMVGILERSINTGAVFVEKKVGHKIFKEYFERFGFGQKIGVDLPGEAKGNISNLEIEREINFATASFGQGIAMTPLQLISAISAIANGGKLIQPYVVEKIIKPDGTEILTQPKEIRQVISSDTANRLTAMLVSVVENGFGKGARVPGYYVAGKTGTAQIPDPEKRGYLDETIHTFVGYAPAYNPKFIILIKLDKPKGIEFASLSISPVFKEIAKFLLNYYEIPPDK